MLPAESSESNLTLSTALGVRSGWKPEVRTRSLRELSDCSTAAGTRARNIRCFREVPVFLQRAYFEPLANNTPLLRIDYSDKILH